MLPLRNLPVYVVIRLCTGQDSIVTYWNSLVKGPNSLEIHMDIIDDPIGEGIEVRIAYKTNNYEDLFEIEIPLVSH